VTAFGSDEVPKSVDVANGLEEGLKELLKDPEIYV